MDVPIHVWIMIGLTALVAPSVIWIMYQLYLKDPSFPRRRRRRKPMGQLRALGPRKS